jgi:hypothetical protein
MERGFTVSGVLSQSFTVLGRNFLILIVTSLAIYAPVTLLTLAATANPDPTRTAFLSGIGVLLSIPISMILQGAVMFGVYESLRGRAFPLGRSVQIAFDRFWLMLGVSILSSLMIMIATLCLIVPGVIVAIMLMVAVPAVVVEDCGVGAAFERSRDLTEGNRWRIFGLVCVIICLAGGAAMVQVAIKALIAESALASTIIDALISSVQSSFSSVLTAVVYYQLRMQKDGLDLDHLASVFE